MRRLVFAVLVAVLVSAGGVLVLAPTPSAPGTPAPPLTPAHLPPAAAPASHAPLRVAPAPFLGNLTYAPADPLPLSSTPTSAVNAEPTPPIPSTTPVVLTLLSSSRDTTYSNNVTAPSGTWARILLNYTGQAVSGVYDSSYRAYLDRGLVLFGTTPEYGQWYVVQDLTQYSVLFHGSFNLTFLLGAAVTNGYFLTSLTLLFYPVANGTSAPVVPGGVAPLWFRTSMSAGSPTEYVDTSLPSNVTNATLVLYGYGFGPDEFWYSSQPGLREIQISSNGTQFLTLLPFQYVNTGGIDLFEWRPITGAFTTNDRAYTFNVTAALGLLEGPHNLSAHVMGLAGTSTWIVGGSILYNTAAAAGPATLSSYSLTAPSPTISSGGSFYDESATTALHYSSNLTLPSGTANVSLWANGTYTNAATMGATWLGATWSNFTSDEAMSAVTQTVTANGTSRESRLYDFPITMNIGDSFVETSSNNGSYPIFGNFTSYLDNVHQEWNESVRSGGANPMASSYQAVDDRVTGTVNFYAGTEELTSPNAALLLSITSVQSQTTKLYSRVAASPTGGGSYTHLVVGSAYEPTNPYDAETVLVNVVSHPLSAELVASRALLDVGGSVTLGASVSGGLGPFTYTWFGLPAGCASADAPTLVCTPTASGTFPVSLVVADGSGALAPLVSQTLVVSDAPSVVVGLNRSALDVGDSVQATVTVTGGTGPFSCRWSVAGGLWTGYASCASGYNYTSTATGTITFSVQVEDSVGGAGSAETSVAVARAPTVGLQPPTGGPFSVGRPVALIAIVTGGAGPVVYTWLLNNTPIAGISGPSYAFVPLAPGSYTFGVEVQDAANATTVSNLVVVAVVPAPSTAPGGGSGSSGLPGGLDWYGFLAIGIAVGLLAGIVLMLLLQPRRPSPVRRPAPPGPPVPRAPAPEAPPPSPPR